MMERMLLDTFCFSLDVWRGSIIAAVFSLLTSSFDILWSVGNLLEEEQNLAFILWLVAVLTDKLAFASLIIMAALNFAILVQNGLFMFTALLLILGLIKEVRCLAVPWLILAFVDIVHGLVVSVILLTIPHRHESMPCIIPVGGLFVQILVSIVMMYCFLCVLTQFVTHGSSKCQSNAISPLSSSPTRHAPLERSVSQTALNPEKANKSVRPTVKVTPYRSAGRDMLERMTSLERKSLKGFWKRLRAPPQRPMATLSPNDIKSHRDAY